MKRITKALSVLLLVAFVLGMFSGCNNIAPLPTTVADAADTLENLTIYENNLPNAAYGFTVHIIDVGQGHSVLVQSDGESMLVDAGEREYGSVVEDFLSSHNVTTLKYAVATHPHSDHIGGMTAVIRDYSIDTFMMPNAQATTDTFEGMLQALSDKQTEVVIPKVGEEYELGSAKITILSPASDEYSNMNDYSIAMRITYEKMAFIMTGDATTRAESEMLESGLELDADVMLVPHHGSDSSSSQRFIDAVSPSIAVISVGEDNDYGHPCEEIVSRYTSSGVALLTTSGSGTVSIGFTPDVYYFATAADTTQEASEDTSDSGEHSHTAIVFVGNKNSHIYHYDTCDSLPAEQNRVYFDNVAEAEAAGYTPCGKCNPN